MVHLRFLWPTLIITGVTAAFLSVIVGNGSVGYGFPFAWKTGGCPPPGIQISTACFLAISYDWIKFGLDALIYTATASVPAYYYARRGARKSSGIRSA